MDRATKQTHVDRLRDIFGKAQVVILTQQNGMTVAEITDLRSRMRQAGARFKVTKNRLARLALKDTKFTGLAERFKGPTGIAYSADPVAAAKAVAAFAKDNQKLTILAGSLDGKVLSVSDVDALAKLPSLDQLRGMIIGLLQAPAQKVARVLQAPAGQLARVFAAYGKKDAA